MLNTDNWPWQVSEGCVQEGRPKNKQSQETQRKERMEQEQKNSNSIINILAEVREHILSIQHEQDVIKRDTEELKNEFLEIKI